MAKLKRRKISWEIYQRRQKKKFEHSLNIFNDNSELEIRKVTICHLRIYLKADKIVGHWRKFKYQRSFSIFIDILDIVKLYLYFDSWTSWVDQTTIFLNVCIDTRLRLIQIAWPQHLFPLKKEKLYLIKTFSHWVLLCVIYIKITEQKVATKYYIPQTIPELAFLSSALWQASFEDDAGIFDWIPSIDYVQCTYAWKVSLKTKATI